MNPKNIELNNKKNKNRKTPPKMSEIPDISEIKEPINNEVNKHEVDKKRKFKEIAPFGNYRSYYGYRVGNDMDQDPRFKVLKKDWFEGKDCLDIGCNSGLITLNIAKKFNCRTIRGVDIDPAFVGAMTAIMVWLQWYPISFGPWPLGKHLSLLGQNASVRLVDKVQPTQRVRIKDAWSNLKNFAQCKKSRNHTNMGPKSKIVTDSNGLRCDETCSTSGEEVKSGCFSMESNLSGIVSFQHGNFVSDHYRVPREKYDTIICLSVTKWVHLNWGDEGLISLFSKIWRHLHPGGILVLEPQPWVSYYKNRRTTETTPSLNLTQIVFNDDNYELWAAVKNGLDAKNKLSFVEGKVTKPTTADDEDIEAVVWRSCNAMLKAWLRNVIDPKLHPSIAFESTVAEVWAKLKDRYSVGNAPRVHQLKGELQDFKQGRLTVVEYYTKLKTI
ncbi:hypothetical protein KSS87_011783 [Heliosperma pusillum]|nr:hypothetical protein KSS87_011783 [Heliosperma pusillum]